MSDGTSFTYAAPEKKMVDKAITDEAKAHVWEHKTPDTPLNMQVCNHCLHVAHDDESMSKHWTICADHKAGGAHLFGTGPNDMVLLKHKELDWKVGPAPIGGTIGDGVTERVAFGEKAVRETFARARIFTRDEVLLVLKALKADTGVVAGREALDKAVRVFEKLE